MSRRARRILARESAEGDDDGPVLAEARRLDARRPYLETNHTLRNAVHLYEAVGFRHLPAERVTPSPYVRADVFMEMDI